MRSIKAIFKIITVCFLLLSCQNQSNFIIDCHTHFKGEEQINWEKANKPTRDPRNTLGSVSVESDYANAIKGTQILGTVVIEAVDHASLEFNYDVLTEIENSSLMLAYIARTDLLSDDFLMHHKKLSKSQSFKGYRIRRSELKSYHNKQKAMDNFKILNSDKVVIDILIRDKSDVIIVEDLAGKFKNINFVINHCLLPRIGSDLSSWCQSVKRLSNYDNIYMKMSSILNFSTAKIFSEEAPKNLDYYQYPLEYVYKCFGQDRIVFGTNWGVCTHFGKTQTVVKIVREFLDSKEKNLTHKVMNENPIRLYKLSL